MFRFPMNIKSSVSGSNSPVIAENISDYLIAQSPERNCKLYDDLLLGKNVSSSSFYTGGLTIVVPLLL